MGGHQRGQHHQADADQDHIPCLSNPLLLEFPQQPFIPGFLSGKTIGLFLFEMAPKVQAAVPATVGCLPSPLMALRADHGIGVVGRRTMSALLDDDLGFCQWRE